MAPNLSYAKKLEAEGLFKKQQYIEALASYNDVIALDPLHFPSYSSVCTCHLVLNMYKEAAEDAEKILVAEPNSLFGYASLAKSSFELGQFDKAADAVIRGLPSSGTDSDRLLEVAKLVVDIYADKIEQLVASYPHSLTFDSCGALIGLFPSKLAALFTAVGASHEGTKKLGRQVAALYHEQGLQYITQEKAAEAVDSFTTAISMDDKTAVYFADRYCTLLID